MQKANWPGRGGPKVRLLEWLGACTLCLHTHIVRALVPLRGCVGKSAALATSALSPLD